MTIFLKQNFKINQIPDTRISLLNIYYYVVFLVRFKSFPCQRSAVIGYC